MVHARWIMYLEVSNPNETADHRLWFVARPSPLAAQHHHSAGFAAVRRASVRRDVTVCARPLSLRAGKIEFRGIGGFFAFVFFLGSFGGSSDGRGGELSEWKRVWDFWWNFWVGDLSRIKQFRRVILVWRDGIFLKFFIDLFESK